MTPEEQKAIRDAAVAKMLAAHTAPCPAGQLRREGDWQCRTPDEYFARDQAAAADRKKLYIGSAIQLGALGLIGYGGYKWSKKAGAVAAVSGTIAAGSIYAFTTSRDMGGLVAMIFGVPATITAFISGGIAVSNRGKRATPNRRRRRR
jgi:hypothetical protein